MQNHFVPLISFLCNPLSEYQFRMALHLSYKNLISSFLKVAKEKVAARIHYIKLAKLECFKN